MKKLLNFVIALSILLSAVSFLSFGKTNSSEVFTYISIPCETDYTNDITIKARYKDTKEAITLSYTYDGKLYAYVPYENSKREIEAFETTKVKFTDYDSSMYQFHTFELLSETGLIMGNEKGEAQPLSEITRAEATALVIRMLGLKGDENTDIPFTDVKKTDWFYGVVAASYKYGMVMGKDETTFAPYHNITREEITVILKRAVDYAKLGYPGNSSLIATDFDSVSDWAKDAYEKLGSYAATDVDLTDPENPKRKINPKKNATRFDVASMIHYISSFCVIYPSSEALQYGFDKAMPKIDGSTSTYPFTEAVYSKLFYSGSNHPNKPKKHSKSHESYEKLINGEIDMMFASVYPAKDILGMAKTNNVELELIPIAYDAMIFFTNKENSLEGLSSQQITDIYVNNKYKSWSEFGGEDALLYPYCRNNDSGSHAQMEKHFLFGNEINEKIRNETTSVTMSNILTDVMNAKTENPLGYGLGYSIYYYFNNMDMFYNTKTELKLLKIDGVYPDDETIANGTYPLSNNTYIVLRKDTPSDSPARKMAEFMLTKKGQECVSEAGFGKLKEGKSFSDKLSLYMKDNENYCISPLSIKLALSLAASGSEGETKNELLNTLGVSDIDKLNELSKDIFKRYSQAENLKLEISNSVWLNKDNTHQNFSEAYKNAVTENFNAEVKITDNKSAVDEINGWVKEKTKGKITKAIDTPDFFQALINAIYFKGVWQNEFFKEATIKDKFTSFDGSVSEADYMKKTAWFPYIKDGEFEAIELKFKNWFDTFDEKGEHTGAEAFDDLDVSMFFIKAGKGVDIEGRLNTLLKTSAYGRKYISLSLPKFKIEYSTVLNDILKDMGIKKAFDKDKAEFAPMVDTGSSWISTTIHKTYISIDEKGCEAAAVTALLMGNTALPHEPYKLSFDSPFKFVIRDNKTGEILFSGGVNKL